MGRHKFIEEKEKARSLITCLFSREVDKQDRTLTKAEGDSAVTLGSDLWPYSCTSPVLP
jgi:hypothetical protein